MTEAQLMAAIVSAVEACAVSSIHAGDVLHHCPVPDLESALDERAFVLLPQTGSAHIPNLGAGWREVEWLLVVTYAWTPDAIARCLADSHLIQDAIQNLPAGNASIGGLDSRPTAAISYGDGLVTATYQFRTGYLAT